MTQHEAPGEDRQPITHEVKMAGEVGVAGSVSANVERALNDVRIGVLGILVGIALTVGFGVPGSWWVQAAAGAASFALSCALIRWRFSRHHLMNFIHRLTG